jgi:predicted nucleic acid-binding protein
LIFLDTGFLFALFVKGDKHHTRVREIFDGYEGRLLTDLFLTTNYVVSETVTLIRKKGHPDPRVRHGLAVDVGQRLLARALGQLYRVSEEEEVAALEYFERHRDKVYSFVDCVSFVVMEKLDIREAFAVDSDFAHRFIVTPGPLPK